MFFFVFFSILKLRISVGELQCAVTVAFNETPMFSQQVLLPVPSEPKGTEASVLLGEVIVVEKEIPTSPQSPDNQ